MKWYAWNKYAIVNFKYSHTQYEKVIKMPGLSISKAIVKGVPVYTLWELPSTIIGHFESSEKAKSKALEINQSK